MSKNVENCTPIADGLLNEWATNPKGPVAICIKQRLLPVEADGEGHVVIYPPTYADIGYNIDKLSDGTRVALIDSVGSQANRLEPAFKAGSGHALSKLVPQIEIVLRKEPCGECDECKKTKKPKPEKCRNAWKEKRSLFDFAHRAADAVVQSSPTLLPKVRDAFDELRKTGNAAPLCTIAPTSLIFGCWDSRGGSGEKLPRLVRSIIRAWNVDELTVGSQFNSVYKSLSQEQKDELNAESARKGRSKLSDKGLQDAPAVGKGGVLVRGDIIRDVSINLVALRALRGHDEEETALLCKYLLAMSLLTATVDIELFLREGCNLRFADSSENWYVVPRRGEKELVDLGGEAAQETLSNYARSAYKHFEKHLEESDLELEHDFDLNEAKKLLAKKSEDESSE